MPRKRTNVPHGDELRYRQGCRCELCKAANTRRCREWRHAHGYKQPSTPAHKRATKKYDRSVKRKASQGRLNFKRKVARRLRLETALVAIVNRRRHECT